MIDLANTVGTPSFARRRATADAPTGLDPPPPAPQRPIPRRLSENGAFRLVSGATTDRVREAA